MRRWQRSPEQGCDVGVAGAGRATLGGACSGDQRRGFAAARSDPRAARAATGQLHHGWGEDGDLPARHGLLAMRRHPAASGGGSGGGFLVIVMGGQARLAMGLRARDSGPSAWI